MKLIRGERRQIQEEVLISLPSLS